MDSNPSVPVKAVLFLVALYASIILAKYSGSAGWKPVEPNSPQIWRFAWKSVPKVNDLYSSPSFPQIYLIPARILNAQTMFLAGDNFKIDIEFGISNCSKEVDHAREGRCVLRPRNYDFQIHTIHVWEQPWKNRTRIAVVS
ncbi:hypothetical protein QR680_004859 [Steinernema hermaphroditum]|uniref:Cystatin domain-containing protein n=1 Tax=Steinernema hermaphroditum TaxID=289476 RepID=A0AA39LUP5_9BILA|nr:hypothetical protein QR680_004859 [Steinernema hermaphroditum]